MISRLKFWLAQWPIDTIRYVAYPALQLVWEFWTVRFAVYFVVAGWVFWSWGLPWLQVLVFATTAGLLLQSEIGQDFIDMFKGLVLVGVSLTWLFIGGCFWLLLRVIEGAPSPVCDRLAPFVFKPTDWLDDRYFSGSRKVTGRN